MPLIHTLNNVRNERNAVQIFHSTHTTTTTIVQKTCFKKEISTYIHTYIHTCIYGPTSNLRREACNAPHHPPLQWNGLTKKLLLLIWGEWWLLSSSWRWWRGVAWLNYYYRKFAKRKEYCKNFKCNNN